MRTFDPPLPSLGRTLKVKFHTQRFNGQCHKLKHNFIDHSFILRIDFAPKGWNRRHISPYA
jgi:hypothetical protein